MSKNKTTKSLKEQAMERLDWRLQSTEEPLATFQKRFAENPAYAFSWADAAFEAAALRAEVQRCQSVLEKVGDVQKLVSELRSQVMRGAQSLPRSTSGASNEMGRYSLEAKGNLFELLHELVTEEVR